MNESRWHSHGFVLSSWKPQDKARLMAKPGPELGTPDDNANHLYSDYAAWWGDSGLCVTIPQNLLVPPWRQTPSKIKLNNCVLWKMLWKLSTALMDALATPWEPTTTRSCFDSGSTISGEIQSHWSELPVSQCPYLPNGDKKSMLSITRIIVKSKGDSSRRRISGPHSATSIRRINTVVSISFRISSAFCFTKPFLVS